MQRTRAAQLVARAELGLRPGVERFLFIVLIILLIIIVVSSCSLCQSSVLFIIFPSYGSSSRVRSMFPFFLFILLSTIASRMAANVPSGVGFVGAGVITTSVRDQDQNPRNPQNNVVHGLTTAATIW